MTPVSVPFESQRGMIKCIGPKRRIIMAIRHTRFALVWLVSAALACFPAALATGHGGGGGGGGGGHGGGGGGGGGGGHMGGGGYGGYSGGYGGHYGSYGGGHSYSGHSYGNFSQPQHNFSTGAGHGDWNHGHYGDWNHWNHNGWNHDGWNHNWAWWPHYGPYWYGGWGFDFWWPWFGFTWWPGCYNYCYGVPYADYGYVAAADNVIPYVAYKPDDAGPDVTLPGATAAAEPSEPGGESSGPGDTFDFYGRAVAAFGQGEFRDATHLAAHAAVDEPRSQKVHLLLSLGLFATGEYRGAAIESHAVASLGKVPDWPTVYGLYNDVDVYTKHLRALEKYVHDKPSSAEGRFLLGFQYMMAGHRDEARDEFLKALKLAPKDRLAAQLLKEEGGAVPPEIAKQLSELPPQKTPAPALPPPPAPQAPPTK